MAMAMAMAMAMSELRRSKTVVFGNEFYLSSTIIFTPIELNCLVPDGTSKVTETREEFLAKFPKLTNKIGRWD